MLENAFNPSENEVTNPANGLSVLTKNATQADYNELMKKQLVTDLTHLFSGGKA